jgi:ElaB/YqjD/DUF883 family membrane-anchored ribosome-binding protein
MSDRIEGSGAAAVGAHSKDAMGTPYGSKSLDQGKPGPGVAPDQGSAASGAAQDLAASARGVADAARSAAGRAGDEAIRAAKVARDGVSRVGGRAYREGAQAGEYVSDLVRSEPLMVLAAVGALGFALGLLIGRR